MRYEQDFNRRFPQSELFQYMKWEEEFILRKIETASHSNLNSPNISVKLVPGIVFKYFNQTELKIYVSYFL